MKKIGYARVSTDDQNLALQMDALRRAGCSTIYRDKGVSGAEFARPGLDTALAHVRRGDTLVVWRLDRLGRSLAKLIDLVAFLGKRGIQFASLAESINTTSPGGILVFHMMAALAEFERALISERTRAGMAAARARGTHIGRRHVLSPARRNEALALLKQLPVAEVAQRLCVHPRTIRRLLAQQPEADPVEPHLPAANELQDGHARAHCPRMRSTRKSS